MAPKKYFELYDPATLPLPGDEAPPPRGAPPGTFNFGMAGGFYDFPPPARQDSAFKRRYLQGYFASISYLDACAGRVLAALRDTGLDRTTIVVVLGDNGYLMGEHGS